MAIPAAFDPRQLAAGIESAVAEFNRLANLEDRCRGLVKAAG